MITTGSTPSVSGPERSPALALWRAGAVPGALAAGAVVAAAAASGTGRAAGAAVGGGLALAGLSTGPALMAISRKWAPPAVMAGALGGYALTVMLLAVGYASLAGAGWLDGTWAGGAVAAVALAWPAGQAWGVARLRVLAFGARTEGDGGGGGAGQGGSPASPRDVLH